ncbi:hypothetical protein [Pseudoalteromonas sp. XMcav11-Q]|uniref:hypothetical protein n=1 Tax=Pseudoalteromonas sp. XMcav11-Q TaxID=3136665 RepID=UPI0032C3FA7D
MINLDALYSDDLVQRYSDFCKQYVRSNLNEVFETLEGELRDNLESYFCDVSLQRLLSSEVQSLELAFREIFDNVPIIAERFNPKYFFRDFNPNTQCAHLNLRTNDGKRNLNLIKEGVIEEINYFVGNNESILLSEVLEELEVATSASEIKKKLTRLDKIINGDIKADDSLKRKFPDWLEGFSSSFNYDYIIGHFGLEIIREINLHYCPYCAEEPIESFQNFRAAIDHYFPKSKFPFLALSLYNFVPAGERCNSRYKRNNDMTGYFNPARDLLPNEALFDFEFPLGREFEYTEIEVIVNDINEQLRANSSMFKLDGVYNKSEVKREFKNLYDRVNMLEALGRDDVLNDPQKTRILLNVDLTISNKRVRFQKFLVDSLNFLAGSNLLINTES